MERSMMMTALFADNGSGQKGTSEETLEYYNGSEKGSLQILDLGNATMVGDGCAFYATELTKLTYP